MLWVPREAVIERPEPSTRPGFSRRAKAMSRVRRCRSRWPTARTAQTCRDLVAVATGSTPRSSRGPPPPPPQRQLLGR
jgi:hypothetical protein